MTRRRWEVWLAISPAIGAWLVILVAALLVLTHALLQLLGVLP